MKKLLGVLLVAVLFLVACGNEANEPENGEEKAGQKPYYVHLIGGPEYHGWFDYLKEKRANAKQNFGDVFIYHKVDSVTDSKELVNEVVGKKTEDYTNLILVGLGPDDYKGGSAEAAEENFNKLKDYVSELADFTLPNDVILMIGNGYPKPAEKTDEHLLWNHEQMRLFLKDQMEETDMIYNFTIKRPLGDENGALNVNMTDEQRYIQLSEDFSTYLTLIKKRI
jgi:hypothetical protein